jgi:hypothetical protein
MSSDNRACGEVWDEKGIPVALTFRTCFKTRKNAVPRTNNCILTLGSVIPAQAGIQRRGAVHELPLRNQAGRGLAPGVMSQKFLE